jgi:beta-galactosidase
MERKLLFNDGWQFTKQAIDTAIEKINDDNTCWSNVDIPHDWLIYNTNDLYETSEGWYKKVLTVGNLTDKVISLCFEGVYMNSTVYVNDMEAGEWKYGYSSFELDITKLLKVGENEIKVRVKYESPNSRWYSGAGIYRNVWLKTTAQIHLVTDGTYISTRKDADDWFVELETEIAHTTGVNTSCIVKHTVLDKEEVPVFCAENSTKLLDNVAIDKQTISCKCPTVWSLENPYCYTLKTEIMVDGITVDQQIQSFGFRTIRYDCNEGFFLNDKWIKLRGVCMHHDLGALGAAVNKVALRRQLEIMKEMGVNAIRTSHNMPATELMDLADEMGILINSEAFDMWELPKTQYDYARFFNDWCEKDVASWIRRDRNHPSIIMWSIGNEIYDTHAGARGLEITKMLKTYVLEHDPKKNGHVTIGSNYIAWDNAQSCADELILSGYNYGERLYEEHHKKYPHWFIYGSETAARVQSRSIYHFPASTPMLTHDDEQCSSLENCRSGLGDRTPQRSIIDDRNAKFCAGQFIWTGFDYIGEPSPYFTKNSYFGQVDTAGFKKDTFYLYQAEWTDYKTNPMVHILPYWDFNDGQLIDIRIYSNAPKTELFVNDKSMGIFEIDHEHGEQLSGEWQIPYHKGTIKAVAYDEEGNIVATDIQSSFGDPAKIILNPNKTEMKADGEDIIFVEITMVDHDGIFVSNAKNRVEVEVSGAGRLIGLDNGDSTDYDQYKGTSRKLFSGKLLAIVASKQDAGEISFKVSSRGLEDQKLIFKAIPCEKIAGVSATTENTKSEANDEIPTRKIELVNKGENKLNQVVSSTKISAKLFPENTTYKNIQWKVITKDSIETNIAKVEADGDDSAIVTAIGDGEFRLRCYCNNGKKTPEVISELEFEITGMGEATINPYKFVSGSLYNASNGEMNIGHLGGINVGEEVVHIGFRGVDFGKMGSDEITIPLIRWFRNTPLPIEIWEGMPGEEGSELITEVTYQADFVWMTYVPNTFKLPKKLTGIKNICFVLHSSEEQTSFKGFEFTPIQKAYEQLFAKDTNRIFGDSFSITEDAIENIGNNVILEFEDMDFGDKGFEKIIICGRSPIENNSIHIHFTDENGDVNQLVEFSYSDEYVEKEFKLQGVKGKQKISFVFLPGCKFDFKWFKFEGGATDV